MIKSKQLAKALYELSEENVHDLDKKFLDFIEKQNLKAQLPSVLYHFEKIVEMEQEKKGIQIETAHDIKHETVNHIKKFLQADHLKENLKIKKELVGGFRAKYGGHIYDASIQTSLRKLEEAIMS